MWNGKPQCCTIHRSFELSIVVCFNIDSLLSMMKDYIALYREGEDGFFAEKKLGLDSAGLESGLIVFDRPGFNEARLM